MSTQNGVQMAGALVAKRLAEEVIELLKTLVADNRRQLELMQSSRKNFLGAGTVAGAGTVGTTAASNIINANPHRRGLNVQNTSASGGPNLTVGLGSTQPQAGAGIVLTPGASWDGRISGSMWGGSVSVVANAAGCAYSWLEAM